MTYDARERRLARKRAYDQRWLEARRLGIPTSYIPAAPAAARLAALHNLGWSNPALEHLTGGEVHRSTFSKLARKNYATVQRSTADAILGIPWTLAPADAIPDPCFVPSLGAQRRIRALLHAGWSHPLIRPVAGCDTEGIVRGRTLSVTAGAWRGVDKAFAELCMKRGPEKKAATTARRLAYVPALAWDDVDDPDETPAVEAWTPRSLFNASHGTDYDEMAVARVLDHGDWRTPTTTAERREIVRRWDGDLAELARLTGWRVHRYMDRGVAS